MKRKRWPTTLNSLLAVAVVAVVVLELSCSAKRVDPQAESTAVTSSSPLFQTKEPLVYRAVRTVTFTDAAGRSETSKTSIARNGALRWEETQVNGEPGIVLLVSEGGRFVLLPDERIYAEVTGPSGENLVARDFENTPERLLHSETLSRAYQKLGPESVNGRNTTKYRIIVNGSPSQNVSNRETLIWIDESIGLPIRSETTDGDGSRMLMEMSDFELRADKSLFRIPTEYGKVSTAEMQKRMHENSATVQR